MSFDPDIRPASALAGPVPTADPSNCDIEPIHIPGSIQSYGSLLVLSGDGARILGAAGTDPRLTTDVIGKDAAQVLDGALGRVARHDHGAIPQIWGKATLAGRPWEMMSYRSGDHLVVEMLPADPDEQVDASFLGRMQALDGVLERATSMPDLYRNAAQAFRELTGYARVLIYRFLDDEAGAVVGESRAPGMSGFMNHHFPASDIPAQARALYVRNRVRVIADARAEVSPIAGVTPGIRDVDLSDSMVRSVSPVHLRYLHNMGVRASASMSIVKDGMLWGLVACHNPEPRDLSLATRLACQSLADSLARQIRLREDRALYRDRLRLRAQEDAILAQLGADDGLDRFFAHSGDALAQLTGADGFAAVQGGDLFAAGICPPPEALTAMAAELRDRAALRPFASGHLERDLPMAAEWRAIASGLLCVTMSTEVPTILMWFRAEKLQVVTWAGNPHDNAPATPGATLEPRASFEAWSDEVRGHSRPWTGAEVEASTRLVRHLLEARNTARIRKLNAELSVIVKENENLIRQKDFLLKEVNHRVQNSLALVASFLRLQARGADAQVRAQLEEAQSRLSAVGLVHRRLYQDDRAEIVDLSIYLDDLMREMKSSLDPSWSTLIQTDFAPISVSADKAVNIGLLTNEIVANAVKYAYQGEAGPVAISLTQWRDTLVLEVADNGAGSDGKVKGTGFGMRLVRVLVEQLGGTLDTESNAPGMRVRVSARID